jgi:hypothetical protein
MPRSRLCYPCRTGLVADLKSLPDLYERCGRVVDRGRCRDCGRQRESDGPVWLVAAADTAREQVLDLLISLCREITPAGAAARGQSVVALVDFAVSHVDALVRWEAAPGLTFQVGRVALGAHRVLHTEWFPRGCVWVPRLADLPRRTVGALS